MMGAELDIGDFAAFVNEVHDVSPFPWQQRLAQHVAQTGRWPEVLDLPTGSGKTAAIDIALFHLAFEAGRGAERRAPVRIAFVVDRRLIVDDAHERAKRIVKSLRDADAGSVAYRVAERLRILSGEEGPPLIARRLRGGVPRENDWARTPAQPTILCSTVDQVGSRLLFRGYGVSDRMKPVHAGLLGADCLILLDEAHLAEPFRQTLEWVRQYNSGAWRERGDAAPWGFAQLSATPGATATDDAEAEPFALCKDDREDATLSRRLRAAKPARLVTIAKTRRDVAQDNAEAEDAEAAMPRTETARAAALAEQAIQALQILGDDRFAAPAIGVVANRVARARATFEILRQEKGEEADVILMIGPARPVDREELAGQLRPIRTRCSERPTRPLIIVATQTIEAGVDIDLDGLITEAAPLDALRQRFGRLDRDGRLNADGRKQGGAGRHPEAVVVAHPSDLGARADDPVYGPAIRCTWALLGDISDQADDKAAVVDFGIDALAQRLADVPREALGGALAPKADAPVLMPAHLDLLSQTAPVPAADPEVALYLHGPRRNAANVTLLWRADIDPQQREGTREIMSLMPARAAEAIELPIWAVRAWLAERPIAGAVADLAAAVPEEADGGAASRKRRVFRWAGADDERSTWIWPHRIRPGDTLVAPASYGGCDAYGWHPGSKFPVTDGADAAAKPFDGRRYTVRVAPGLLADGRVEGATEEDEQAARALADRRRIAVGEVLADRRDSSGPRVLAALLDCDLPSPVRDRLKRLETERRGRLEPPHFPYGEYEDGGPRGVVLVAPLGLRVERREDDIGAPVTEDDAAGSTPGYAVPLAEHLCDVEDHARRFAERAGLHADRVEDLALAGFLHDLGKADRRFQAMLAGGDILWVDDTAPLAKSAYPAGRDAWRRSGLPQRWRHEALSARLARHHPRLAEARDPDLVLWLIGTHHGEGRPLYPHADEIEEDRRADFGLVLGRADGFLIADQPGPQSLAFDWDGLDWPSLFERLKVRYGVFELARLEAIVRLADHRASEQSQRQAGAREAPAAAAREAAA